MQIFRVLTLLYFLLSSFSTAAQDGAYPPITPGNAADLTLVAEVGAGLVGEIVWSADGEYLAVDTLDELLIYQPLISDQPLYRIDGSLIPNADHTAGFVTRSGLLDPATGILTEASAVEVSTPQPATDDLISTIRPSAGIRVPQAVVSDDGLYLAALTRAQDGLLIWEMTAALEEGQPLAQVRGEDRIVRFTFSPDSQYIFTEYQRGHAAIWRTDDGSRMSRLPNFCESSRFSADSTLYIGAGCEIQGIVVYDVLTGMLLSTLPQAGVFSSNDRFLAHRQHGMIEIYDTETGVILNTLQVIPDYLAPVLAFDGQNGQIVFGNDVLRCFDVLSGEQRCEIEDVGGAEFSAAVWSENGDVLVLMTPPDLRNKRLIYAYDVRRAESLLGQMQTDWNPYDRYFLTPDGRHLIRTRQERPGVTMYPTLIEIADLEVDFAWNEATTFHSGFVTALDFSADGRYAAFGVSLLAYIIGDSEIRIYPANQFDHPLLTLLIESEDEVMTTQNVEFSSTARYLAAQIAYHHRLLEPIRHTFIWAVDDSQTEPTPIVLEDTINLAFSGDEQYAVGSSGSEIGLWEVASLLEEGGSLEPLLTIPAGYVEQFAFTPDGGILAARTSDQVIAWDFTALVGGETEPLLTLDVPQVAEIAFSPDGTLLYVVTPNRAMAFAVSAAEATHS